MNYDSCILEAHQGVASEAPGNTMAAFRLAVEQGYGMLELDTKFTADDRCVILHDHTVNRTCRLADGSPLAEERRIDSLTLAEARELDAGIAYSEKYRGERIPTLEEVLALAVESGIKLKLDNVLQTHTPEQRELLYREVEEAGATSVCGFTAFSPSIAEEIMKRLPTAELHYDGPLDNGGLERIAAIVPREQLTVWQRANNGYADSWCSVPPVTEESAAAVHRVGKLGLWLLTKPEELDEAIARFGADVVETDGRLKPRQRA